MSKAYRTIPADEVLGRLPVDRLKSTFGLPN